VLLVDHSTLAAARPHRIFTTSVIENSEPNFRKGSEAEIQTKTLPQSTG
jgi:hypothetical protein